MTASVCSVCGTHATWAVHSSTDGIFHATHFCHEHGPNRFPPPVDETVRLRQRIGLLESLMRQAGLDVPEGVS